MSVNGDVRVDPVDIRGDINVVLRGEDGLSAYEVAVKNGFSGTEEEWLESLKGEAARAEAYTNEAKEYWQNAQASAIQSGNSAVEAARYRNEAQDIRDAFAPEVADARAAIQAEKEEAEQKKLLVDDAAANAHLDREQADADAAEVRYLYNETIVQKNVATDAAERARQYAQGAGGYASEAQQHSQEAEGFAQQAQAREEQCTVLWENMKTFPDTARLYMEEAGRSATLASQEADKAHSSAVLASQEAYQAGQIKLDMLNYGETLRQDMDACESRTEGYSIQAKEYADLAGASAEMVQDKIDTSVAEAVTEQLAGKLDVNGKAVDSAHADNADEATHAGDADTVNGHTVETSVPPNAVFTDTTYEVMASSELEDGVSTQGRLIDAHTLATFILTVAADVVNNAPEALDTLAELAQALGDDPNFATTVMNAIGQKLDKAGGVVTGDLTVNGTLTGNVSGSSGSCTGNAATATKLATARTLWGASFDGSGNVSGNMSSVGSVTYSDTAANATRNLLYAKMGDNDYFRVLVGGASNGGYAEIATADDGNEPIYVRQYSGVFSTLTRTATLLDGSGDTTFPGKVTASGGFAGNVTGNCSGSSGSCTGNAATASSAEVTQQSHLAAGFYNTVYADYGQNNVGGMRIGFDAYNDNANSETGKLNIDVRGARSRVAVRQWTDWSRWVREATILDPDGNSSFPGQVEAQRLRCYGIRTEPYNIFDFASIVLREKNGVCASQTDFTYAPSIGFHWGGVCAGSLSMHSDNKWYLRKQDGTTRATLDADIQGDVSGKASTAGTADNANKLGGLSLSPITTGAVFNTVPRIHSDGVMEVGRYIDFHPSNTEVDYEVRIDSAGGKLSSSAPINAPSFEGNLTGNAATATTASALAGTAKITPEAASTVGTPSADSKLHIKMANTSVAPNNGVILEFGNVSAWTGQLYLGDNADLGMYWNGWSNGVRGSWKKIAFTTDNVASADKINGKTVAVVSSFSNGVLALTGLS